MFFLESAPRFLYVPNHVILLFPHKDPATAANLNIKLFIHDNIVPKTPGLTALSLSVSIGISTNDRSGPWSLSPGVPNEEGSTRHVIPVENREFVAMAFVHAVALAIVDGKNAVTMMVLPGIGRCMLYSIASLRHKSTDEC